MTARRRKPSPLARIRPFWMPIALVGAIGVLALAFAATWPGFGAKRVEIVGNHRVPSGEILARAQVARGRSIWLANTGAMARRIEEIPYVERVSIYRIPPAIIRISIAERRPYAVLRSPPESVVVDRALRVLDFATGTEQMPVLLVRPGLELSLGRFVTAREALALRDAYDAVSARRIVPLVLAIDRYGGLVVTLRGGLKLLLGQENDLPQKLSLVDAILSQVVRGQRRIAAIDVRAPGTPVVVYR